MGEYSLVRPPRGAPLVLSRAFYQRPTTEVARALLGKVLVRETPDGIVMLRVNEVEAYVGPGDLACHTVGGRRTPRVESMWGDAGHAYVYLIYGMHHCLNAVTVGNAAGEAVLIRGASLIRGDDLVRSRRGPNVLRRDLVNGPGKLCQALQVDRDQDGVDLCDKKSRLWFGDDGSLVADRDVRRTPRIGIASVGDAAEWPLRFVIGSAR